MIEINVTPTIFASWVLKFCIFCSTVAGLKAPLIQVLLHAVEVSFGEDWSAGVWVWTLRVQAAHIMPICIGWVNGTVYGAFIRGRAVLPILAQIIR